MKTKERILNYLKNHSNIASSELVEHLGFSRQTIAFHLKSLVASGKIEKIGSTKSAKYCLLQRKSKPPKSIQIKKVVKNKDGLAEDQIFEEVSFRAGLKKNLPNNVYSIVYYAFTEMVNNAIDHSDSENIEVELKLKPAEVEFFVRDKGIGVFERIKRGYKLENHFQSIELITKGKHTTMPERHSGQGLFFTSKISDLFTVKSHRIELSFDNRNKDLFVHEIRKLKGTGVHFIINRNSKKKLAKLFDDYANQDYEFDKTLVWVKLSGYDNLLSRSQARRTLLGLEKFDRIEFDFKGVSGIGQAFADQIFRIYAQQNIDKQLTYKNTNQAVKFMIERAKITE